MRTRQDIRGDIMSVLTKIAPEVDPDDIDDDVLLRVQVDLDGRVAARVDDHASLNLLDAHLVCIGVGGKELRGIGPEFIKTLAQGE